MVTCAAPTAHDAHRAAGRAGSHDVAQHMHAAQQHPAALQEVCTPAAAAGSCASVALPAAKCGPTAGQQMCKTWHPLHMHPVRCSEVVMGRAVNSSTISGRHVHSPVQYAGSAPEDSSHWSTRLLILGMGTASQTVCHGRRRRLSSAWYWSKKSTSTGKQLALCTHPAQGQSLCGLTVD